MAEKIFAILGDIHANLEALDAVLADCRVLGVTDYLCTGDVVGYGANPHECLTRIRELNCPIVIGNHDYYVSHTANLSDFNPYAAAVIKWTHDRLTQEERDFLSTLPASVNKMGITLVHATLDNPLQFGYVFDTLQANSHFSRQITPLCFHGHTHCPTIFERQGNEVNRYEAQDFRLEMGRKYFINVGSVGQPRDGDCRAAYVLYSPQTKQVVFRRLPYDIATAQARIREAGLPERLAERLAVGQ